MKVSRLREQYHQWIIINGLSSMDDHKNDENGGPSGAKDDKKKANANHHQLIQLDTKYS